MENRRMALENPWTTVLSGTKQHSRELEEPMKEINS